MPPFAGLSSGEAVEQDKHLYNRIRAFFHSRELSHGTCPTESTTVPSCARNRQTLFMHLNLTHCDRKLPRLRLPDDIKICQS